MRPGNSDGRREKETYVASKAIVGEKVGMTQVWDDQNRAVPVTVLKVAPVRVVQVKTPETDGYAALQVTWGFRRNSTLTKPQLGHYAKAGVNPGRALVELRLTTWPTTRWARSWPPTCGRPASGSTPSPSARARASPAA